MTVNSLNTGTLLLVTRASTRKWQKLNTCLLCSMLENIGRTNCAAVMDQQYSITTSKVDDD